MCGKMLKNPFRRSEEGKPTPQSVPEHKEYKPRKWWEFPFRLINPSRGGFNMPKYQRCPECGAEAKRQFKTDFGAIYLCRCKKRFAVSR